MPELFRDLATMCKFVKVPSEPKELTLAEGIEFENGFFEGVAIKKIVFFPQVIYLDTGTSTEEAQRILLTLLEWAKVNYPITFERSMIRRWAFVSDVVFRTDFPFLEGQSPILARIGQVVSEEVRNNLREPIDFTPGEFKISHDPQMRESGIAPFSVTHRANMPHNENLFFAEAPIPTTLHLEILRELEREFRQNYESQ